MRYRLSTTPRASRRDHIFSADDDTAEFETDTSRRRLISRRKWTPSGSAPAVHHHIDRENGPAIYGIPRLALTEALDDLPVEEHLELESETGSFTLKKRQQVINETHPFGIRLWKPALYRQGTPTEDDRADIHSVPGQKVSLWSLLFNTLWTILFGWWLAVLAAIGGLVCIICPTPSSREYGLVLCRLAGYLFYPFGKLVRLEKDDRYLDQDAGQGRSMHEYEQWQNGTLNNGHLFFGPEQGQPTLSRQSTMLGRGQWNSGRIIFLTVLYIFILPPLLLVSLICWALVFTIPMAKTTTHLLRHLQCRPLDLSFDSDGHSVPSTDEQESKVLLCTYSAVGFRYWRYSIGGNRVFLIDLMVISLLIVFNWLVLQKLMHIHTFDLPPTFLFPACLAGIIPLAYFIGQAVASISAQSSMGLSAVANAVFSTIFEVLFYCVALKQGKGRLVEGCVIGSIFAGILFLPGLSMCVGALKRKTQRFNSKSAGVTSTMLLFATIGIFSPTLFYAVHGTHVMRCRGCSYNSTQSSTVNSRRNIANCRTCSISQELDLHGNLYIQVLRPFSYLCATLLLLAYAIGLWFTLRTHAAIIWTGDAHDKKNNGRGQHPALKHPIPVIPAISVGTSSEAVGVCSSKGHSSIRPTVTVGSPHERLSPIASPLRRTKRNTMVPEVSHRNPAQGGCEALPELPEEDNSHDLHRVRTTSVSSIDTRAARARVSHDDVSRSVPNWSRTKSLLVLFGATLLYGVLANIIMGTVDSILKEFHVDEKFVGLTIFALVPNTTEIWNAILFATNGNIALSMEIGSAYVLQVCLLQIPALVFFSAAFHSYPGSNEDLRSYVFPLVFPQWDMVLVIICVFLLGYMYSEGKSNYFKGSILLLAYVVVISGFYFSGV
ncbi:Calcium permease [Fusarium albosuccineum]|uniref:Calcium permease n=1 Tax=Fusarium albosuccineum TaxID=1237068 RepID=A0A8H4L410_9HYPO|nr:Calcium permease [Fusarium albosuccineum]